VTGWTDLLFILVLVLDLFVLASSRLRAGIRAVAAQGVLLSLLPVVLSGDATETRHVAILAVGALVVKAVGIPWLLARATRESTVSREVTPLLGFLPSLVLGAAGIAAAIWFAADLPLPVPGMHPLLVPTSIGTVWCGLLLIVTRRKAVGQVLGLRNGASLVMTAFGGTAVIFLVMASLATTIKRDLSNLGKFLTVGAVILFFAFIVNFFLQSSALMLTLLVVCLGIFSAFMVYDVKRVLDGGETNYVSATLALYLDIYNVFQSLLAILGIAGGDRE